MCNVIDFGSLLDLGLVLPWPAVALTEGWKVHCDQYCRSLVCNTLRDKDIGILYWRGLDWVAKKQYRHDKEDFICAKHVQFWLGG
jgi:hypothetical protein